MARVRVHNFTISLDGYGAGPRQTREEPLGVGGEALHDWFIPTRAFQRINGKTGGIGGVDDEIAARFGPVFVLTHHPRPPIQMEGGTVFQFVGSTGEALERAVEAAEGTPRVA